LRLPVDTGKLGPITWLEQQALRQVLRRQGQLLHQLLEQQQVLLEQLRRQQVLREQQQELELQEELVVLFCRKQTKQQQR
jgi:hypothetical protein